MQRAPPSGLHSSGVSRPLSPPPPQAPRRNNETRAVLIIGPDTSRTACRVEVEKSRVASITVQAAPHGSYYRQMRYAWLVFLVACGGSSSDMHGDPDAPSGPDAPPPIPNGCITDVSTGDHVYTCGGLQ